MLEALGVRRGEIDLLGQLAYPGFGCACLSAQLRELRIQLRAIGSGRGSAQREPVENIRSGAKRLPQLGVSRGNVEAVQAVKICKCIAAAKNQLFPVLMRLELRHRRRAL